MSEVSRLLKKAARGDGEAFIALVSPYEKQIYAVCLRMMQNPADAADAMQDTMLRAFRALPDYKATGSLCGWLCRIAANLCLDRLRSKSRHPEDSMERLREDTGFDIAEPGTPYEALEEKERKAVLEQALARLPAEDRALLLHRAAAGLSYEELADSLELPVGTVKSRLNRARQKLKKILWPDRELFSDQSVSFMEGGKKDE